MEKENEEKKPFFKEFCVDGKVLGRWVKENSVTEYDERGNEIHRKDSDGNESWCEYEYDDHGNQIHQKSSYGNESWHEYEYWENGKIKKEICYAPM